MTFFIYCVAGFITAEVIIWALKALSMADLPIIERFRVHLIRTLGGEPEEACHIYFNLGKHNVLRCLDKQRDLLKGKSDKVYRHCMEDFIDLDKKFVNGQHVDLEEFVKNSQNIEDE